jgi:hypothetical protein
MGGDGSGGNRGWKATRRLVETCTWLDARQVLTRKALSLLRRDARVEMIATKGTESFTLVLRLTDFGGIVLETKRFFSQRLELAKVRLTYGDRYFFRCDCGRRCAKVYLPPGESFFKCRACYRLTYSSSNESRPQLWRTLMQLQRQGLLRW